MTAGDLPGRLDRLWPEPTQGVEITDVLRPARPEANRAFLTLSFVTSVDGAVTVDGHSGPLSDPVDQAVLRGVRLANDVVLVGAATVRKENYGPIRLSPEEIALRRQWGLAADLPLALVSSSLDFDPRSRWLETGNSVIFTSSEALDANRERANRLADRAEIVPVGDREVDFGSLLDHLKAQGRPRVACEGGPRLAAALLGRGLVDQLQLSISPVILGSESDRLSGPVGSPRPGEDLPLYLEMIQILAGNGILFVTYRRTQRRRDGAGTPAASE